MLARRWHVFFEAPPTARSCSSTRMHSSRSNATCVASNPDVTSCDEASIDICGHSEHLFTQFLFDNPCVPLLSRTINCITTFAMFLTAPCGPLLMRFVVWILGRFARHHERQNLKDLRLDAAHPSDQPVPAEAALFTHM